MTLTKSAGAIAQQYQNTTDLQARELKTNTIAELVTGERYRIDNANLGNGLLLANGNYANPINAIEFVNPLTASGQALAGGIINQIRDDGDFTLPLANSVPTNTILVIELPDTFGAQTPTLTRSGTDLIRHDEGTDTDIQWVGPARITLTSNGVSEWSL